MLIVFLKGLIVGLGASIPLGPLGVLCIQKTLSKGKWSGFLTGLGASFSDTFYSMISLLGFFFVDDFVASHRGMVLFIGGIVILLIGLKVYSTNPVKQIKQKNNKSRHVEDFFEALAMTITNPGSIFLIFGMFAAVNLDLSGYETRGAGFIVLWGIFIGSAAWWFTLSTVVNIFRKRFRLKQLILLNKISGIVIAVLGAISFFEGALEVFFV